MISDLKDIKYFLSKFMNENNSINLDALKKAKLLIEALIIKESNNG